MYAPYSYHLWKVAVQGYGGMLCRAATRPSTVYGGMPVGSRAFRSPNHTLTPTYSKSRRLSEWGMNWMPGAPRRGDHGGGRGVPGHRRAVGTSPTHRCACASTLAPRSAHPFHALGNGRHLYEFCRILQNSAKCSVPFALLLSLANQPLHLLDLTPLVNPGELHTESRPLRLPTRR